VSSWTETRDSALRRLARPSGLFAMVAMDQRESLRAMFAERMPEPIERDQLVAFKLAVARILSPHASALLIDREQGLEPLLAAGVLDPGCALIVAADDLVQPVGGPVEDTSLDEQLDMDDARRRGADALKLLVIWRSDRPAARREALVGAFLERSRSAGLPGIVEGVIRPPAGRSDDDWPEREDELLEATREFGTYRPDLYKAQVPFAGRGDLDAITERCRSMTSLLRCPWVVLSAGVAIDDFPRGVESACRGGASGFLAGRAMWRDAIGPNRDAQLREVSVPRLRRLCHVVDELGRPWPEEIGS
jgi:sulfofructosephosphate aldolase